MKPHFLDNMIACRSDVYIWTLHIFKFTDTAKPEWNINKDQFYTIQIVTHAMEATLSQPKEERYLFLHWQNNVFMFMGIYTL